MTRGRPVKRRKRSTGEGSIYTAYRGDIKYWLVRVTLPDGTRTLNRPGFYGDSVC